MLQINLILLGTQGRTTELSKNSYCLSWSVEIKLQWVPKVQLRTSERLGWVGTKSKELRAELN